MARITAGRRAFSQACSTSQRDVVHRPRSADHRPVQHAAGAPIRRFVGCGAPRGTAESKARFGGIWIRVAGSAPVGGKILPVPSPVAGPRGVQRAGPGAGAVAVVHGPERAGGGGSCRIWEPSTSSGSWNVRPPNRLRLAGLACLRGGQMITPRWTLSAAIAIPPSCGGSSPRCATAPVVLRAEPAGAAGGWAARRGRIRRAPRAACWGGLQPQRQAGGRSAGSLLGGCSSTL